MILLKKYNPEQRKGAIIFGLIIGIIIGSSGAFITFSVYPGKMDEMKKVREIPLMDYTRFNFMDTGGSGGIVGHLARNNTLDESGLVACYIDRWQVEIEDRKPKGSWVREKEKWPSLTITFDGGLVKTSPGMPQWLKGLRHESVIISSDSPAALYNDQQLGNGSLRTLGVKNQDPVTVIGTKIGQQTVKTEYFYVGTWEEFLKSLALSAKIFLGFGIALMVAGVLVALAVIRSD